MTDYEQNAINLVDSLKAKQDQELIETRAYWTERFYNEKKWSK